MTGADGCLQTIEEALSRATSPLSIALRDLGSHIEGRGACLVVEHDTFGEALIADGRWSLDREETLRNCERLALVDLRQDCGVRRLAVLVEPLGSEARLDAAGCGLALAALSVTQALAEIAAPYDEPEDVGKVRALRARRRARRTKKIAAPARGAGNTNAGQRAQNG